MAILNMFIKKENKAEIKANDALLRMEQMAAQMAAISGNKVTTDICERRISDLENQNRILRKGLA